MTGIAVALAAVAGVAFGWTGFALSAIAVALTAVVSRARVTAAASAVVLAVALLGAWRGDAAHHPASAATVPDGRGAVRVVTAPERGNQFQQFVVVPDPGDDGHDSAAGSRLCVVAPSLPVVRLGDRLRLAGDARPARDLSSAARLYLRYSECVATLFAESIEIAGYHASAERSLAELRSAISGVLRRSAPGDAGVLLSGLVTGDDTGFSEARAAAFIRTGTTHLTAVSGSNLALVAGFLGATGALTVGRHRLTWQLLTLVGIWSYAAISGAQAPVIRAAVVASAAVLAFRVGRRPDFVTLILLAAGGMVLFDPSQLEALGFRLSVASSLTLAIVVPSLLAGPRASPLAAALMATAAAQLATLPLLLPVFGTVSLTSPVANIAAAPLVALATPLAALAALTGLVWPPLGELVAAPAALVATVLLEIVDRLGAPAAAVSVGAPTTMVAVVIAAAAAAVLVFVGGMPRRGVAGRIRRR